jgi:hypothetical protein
MQLGMADAGRELPDDHLIGPRIRYGHFLDAQDGGLLRQYDHSGGCAHGFLSLAVSESIRRRLAVVRCSHRGTCAGTRWHSGEDEMGTLALLNGALGVGKSSVARTLVLG